MPYTHDSTDNPLVTSVLHEWKLSWIWAYETSLMSEPLMQRLSVAVNSASEMLVLV